MSSHALHKIFAQWGRILILICFSACGTTPAVEKNIRGPEYRGMTIKEKETALKPVFNRSMKMEEIYSVSLSNDGRYMVIGKTNLLELWDLVKGGEGKTIESDGMRDITSLQFSPDDRLLAVGGYGSIELWNVMERTLYKKIEADGDYITLLTFSPDGRFLAACSRGGIHSIRIWEVDSGRAVKILEWDWQYSDEARAMAFSHDGLRLASVAMDNMVRIWNIRSGQVEKGLNREKTDIPVSLSFSPDGEAFAIGTADGQVVLWRLTDGLIIRRIDAHKGSIPTVRFSKDGQSLLTAGLDQRIRLWDAATGIPKETKYIDRHISKLALTEDGQTLAVISREEAVSYRIVEPGGVPPMIVILYPGDQQTLNKPVLTISAKVVDDTGINDIVLEVNGVDVQGEGIGTRDLAIRPTGERKEMDLNWDVSLKRGLNQITLAAYDMENLVARKSIAVHYEEERGDVWGVVIGISRYQHIEGLRYADKDALGIYEYLTKDNGIPESHITYLSNEEATLQRIKDVLGVEIKGKVKEKDTVVIYFAGHGASEPDRESLDGDGLEKYFLTHDSDPRRLYSTALPMQEVARMLGRIDAERIVLIQDTCYSGASGGRTIQTASIRATLSDAYLNRITKGKGRVIITASKANEVSMEKESLGHGVFTYYLLEALRYGDTDSDGFITTGEAFRYVSEKVPAATGRNQHPVKKGEEIEGEIIIGKVRE